MSIATLILGESGTGKSNSMREMNPAETLLIQVVRKPLPFRFKAKGWDYFSASNPKGNIFFSDNAEMIKNYMLKTKRKTIVIDDFQYMLANEFMNRSGEPGFTKFTEIAKHAWSVIKLASELPDDVRVYILSHVETKEDGTTKCKTIGKLLDEKITLEGLFTIVLRTHVSEGEYKLSTKNSGSDTVKSPVDLFDRELIDNDLANIDSLICKYYEITKQEAA